MRVTKLLALAAAAVVAAACNGISPGSPNAPTPDATVAADDATALADATASKGSVDSSPCRDISEVALRLLRSAGDDIEPFYLEVKAVYLKRGLPVRCATAPLWSSKPHGRLIPTRDPFVVKVIRTRPLTTVEVSAQAPNGVRGSIRVR